MRDDGVWVPTVRHWLAGRSDAERATLAQLWSLQSDPQEAPERLADELLQPAVIDRLLASLSEVERAALRRLQERGGTIPAAVLEREFGGVRAHGDGAYPNPRAFLLALEQPLTPTERLYVLALVLPRNDGCARHYCIPADVLAMLPRLPAPALRLSPSGDPPVVVPGDADTAERAVLTLLRLAQDGQLETNANGALSKASLLHLSREWEAHAEPGGLSREEQWPYGYCLRRVAEAAGLLRVGADGRLRPTRVALEWMRAPALDRARWLLDGWIATGWDELANVAGVKLRHAEGRDLARARRAILRLLGQAPGGCWIAFDSFTAAVKQVEPDFARPDGCYDTWGAIDRLGRSIDGFEHWDAVEGEQLRAAIGSALRWLGLIDLGVRDGVAQSFRINALGAALLGHGVTLAEPTREPLVVLPDGEVLAPASASLYARFQLARIAERQGGRDAEVYHLTRRSLHAALDRGIGLDDIVRFLNHESAAPPPPGVLEALREWASDYARLTLRRAVLLEADEPALLERVERDRRVRMPPVERLTDTAWVVREGDAVALAERLRRAGYGLLGDAGRLDVPLNQHDLTVLYAALEFYARACALLGLESDASLALRRRLARLLGQRQLERAAGLCEMIVATLQERLEITTRQGDTEPSRP